MALCRFLIREDRELLRYKPGIVRQLPEISGRVIWCRFDEFRLKQVPVEQAGTRS